MLDGGVLGAGVVLGDPHQGGRQHQTHHGGAKQAQLAACGGNGIVRNQPSRDKVKRHQRQHACNGQALVKRGHDVFHAGAGLDKKASHDGRNDGHCTQCQGVKHRAGPRVGKQQSAQNHSGNQGDGIGFKQVGGHACAISHVVSHVVGNHSGVARVVFRNSSFYLANQVGADVGPFGENTSTQAGKN